MHHAAVIALRNSIEGGHPQARRHIDARLGRSLVPQLRLHFLHQRLESASDVHIVMPDTQVVNEFEGIVNVRLHTIGHGYADYALTAQCLYAQGSGNAAVLAAGNAQHGATALSVFLEPVPYPLYALILNFSCVEHSLFRSCIYLNGAAFKVEVLP